MPRRKGARLRMWMHAKRKDDPTDPYKMVIRGDVVGSISDSPYLCRFCLKRSKGKRKVFLKRVLYYPDYENDKTFEMRLFYCPTCKRYYKFVKD